MFEGYEMGKKDRSATILRENLLQLDEFKDPNLATKIWEEADKAIVQAFDHSKDRWEGLGFHLAIVFLGLALFASLGGGLYMYLHGLQAPNYLTDIGTTSLGALSGLVVSPSLKS